MVCCSKITKTCTHSSGAAKHWLCERLSAILLALLLFPFLIPFLSAIGGGYNGAVMLYQQTFHAMMAISFIVVACYHLNMGLGAVIDDYVRSGHKIIMIGKTFLSLMIALIGVVSILKIYLAT